MGQLKNHTAWSQGTQSLSASASWSYHMLPLMHSLHRKHQEVVCLFGRASDSVSTTLGHPNHICVYIFKGTFIHALNYMVRLQIRLLRKKKSAFPLAGLCGSLFGFQPRSHPQSLLVVQFRSFCFVSAWFFRTCFCTAVFPSAGRTTLWALVLTCFRELCSTPLICTSRSAPHTNAQRHT